MSEIEIDYLALTRFSNELLLAAQELGRTGDTLPDVDATSEGAAALEALRQSVALNAGCVCANMESAAAALVEVISVYREADYTAERLMRPV